MFKTFYSFRKTEVRWGKSFNSILLPLLFNRRCEVAVAHNELRINEVLKGACRIFQVSTTLFAPFKILFNLLLSAAAVSCYKLHSENCTKGLIFFFFVGGFSFFFKNNWFDYQQLTQPLKKYLKKYLPIQKLAYL